MIINGPAAAELYERIGEVRVIVLEMIGYAERPDEEARASQLLNLIDGIKLKHES